MSDPTDREEPGRIRDLPERFGRYTILKRLGKGGMGAVYLARDSQLQRNVALKVPSFAAGEDREIVIRFQREAQAAARLRHPNICPVYDVSEFEGIHFLTMAYIEGHTLDAFIQPDFSLPPSHVAAVVRKIALALQKAHDAGIVHRDLKPSNIMVDQRCEPVIMDFGLARRAGPEVSQLTRSGVLLGTPAYMSPEQVMAHPDEIGFATDIYSLGVVLYQLLTGRLPFRGQAAAVIGQILTVEPTSPRVHRPDLDPELASVCLKALAKKPHDRYPCMTEFAAALEPFACQTRHTQLPDAPRSPGTEGENDPRTLIEIFEATALQSGAGPHEAAPPISNGRIRKHRWLRVTLATLAAVSLTTAIGLVLCNGKPAELAHKRSPGPGHGVQDATAAGSASSSPSPARQVPAPVATPLEASAARDAQRQWSSFLGLPVEMTNSLGMRFRLIPPGRFTMGAAADEIAEMERQARMEQEPTWAVQFMKDNPFPAHHVVITRPFYLGTCEVTQGEYETLMQSNPSVFREPILRGEQGEKDPAVYPVDHVSWEDSVEFCRRLSENPAEMSAGRAYRLPTEAEWEYACRAGTVSRYWFGDDPLAYDQYAWCARNSQGRPHPVGLKPPNAWGLHDMLGNVWEWCQDWYDKEYYSGSPANDPAGPSTGQTRVYRGQSWYWDSPNVLGASSFRLCDRPDFRSYDIGFRVACPLGDRNETKTGLNMLSTNHTGVEADVSGR